MAKTLRVRVKRTGIERTVNERSYKLAEKLYDLLGEVTPTKAPEPVKQPATPPPDPNGGLKPGTSNPTVDADMEAIRENYKALFGRFPRSDWSNEIINEKISEKLNTSEA